MKILRSIDELRAIERPIHAAIGVFDGVHRGHRAVIGAAMESAAETGGLACVITFDPHPVRVLAPTYAPRLLTATEHKLRILESMGIDHVVIVNFDREFAETPAERFIRSLHECAHSLEQICVGEDWRFGKGGTGDVSLLKDLGSELGFGVSGVETLRIEGMIASSTRIREAVASGDFAIAEKLLGRAYTVLGTVIEGRQLGRQLGFPTANLTVHSEQLPPTGVYAVRLEIKAGLESGEVPGVANLGYRPSVEGNVAKRLLEVHLLDWEGDLYGKDVEVRFVEFLRGEVRFDGLEALKQQIESDVKRAREILGA